MLDLSTVTPQQLPEPTKRGAKTNTYATLIGLKTLLCAIHYKPMTQPEIMEVTGLANSTVSRWLKMLSTGSNKLVYIAGWVRKGERGNYSAVWASGFFGENAPKPKPLTQAQYAKRWRNKVARAGLTDRSTNGVLKHVSER